jgi:hypothetical protein
MEIKLYLKKTVSIFRVEDGGSTILRNICNLLPVFMAITEYQNNNVGFNF